MRGDVYDARGFVKTTTGGPSDQNTKSQMMDIDLDIKLGAIVGFNGEALRSLDLKLSRRAGQIRTFGMNAKLGRDSVLVGDLRGRPGGRQVIYLETSDAGALFRFSDVYARMTGGQMWVAMDPPAAGACAAEGILNVRDFSVRGEAQLERAVAGPPDLPQNGIEFSRMRVEFTRSPGRILLRDGVVRGPIIGATIDGQIDYAAMRCICAARWCRSTARTTCSASCRSSVCSSAARRKASSASPTRWSAGRAIRCCGSTRSRRWRRACCARFLNFRPTPTTTGPMSRVRSDDEKCVLRNGIRDQA